MQPIARTIALMIGAWLLCLAGFQAWSAAGAEPAISVKSPAKTADDAASVEIIQSEQSPAAAPAPPGVVVPTSGAHADAAAQDNTKKVINSIYILMLAGFVGFEVIGRVSPLLHTPLMSATNAISGISLVGSLVAAGSAEFLSQVLGFVAVTAATINVVGGFMITDRMLRMFKLRGKEHHG